MLKEESAFADVRLLAAVSCGGVLGALARYGLQTAYPHQASEFGWATLSINVSGCLLIGIIAVLIASAPGTHRLVRPFLVTGVLGGYTTFSTYIVDIQRALVAGAPRTALLYGAATLVAALAAAWAGMRIGEAVATRLGAAGRRPADSEVIKAELAGAQVADTQGGDAQVAGDIGGRDGDGIAGSAGRAS
jgi:CrcB protein